MKGVRKIPYDITYMWNLNYDTNKHIYETENKHTDAENRLVVVTGREGLELGVSICKLLYTEQISKVLWYRTRNCIQYPVINHHGKEYEKEYIYIFSWRHTA